MTIVVLLILAAIWAAVLIPPLMGARAEARPGDSIGDFRRQLTVLRRAAPVSMPPAHTMAAPSNVVPFRPVAPATLRESSRRRRTLKRRRDVFYALLSAMAGTLLLGVIPGLHALLGLHLVLDMVFAGYVALLIRMRNETAEHDMKVRFLPQAPHAAESMLALRRSAN